MLIGDLVKKRIKESIAHCAKTAARWPEKRSKRKVPEIDIKVTIRKT